MGEQGNRRSPYSDDYYSDSTSMSPGSDADMELAPLYGPNQSLIPVNPSLSPSETPYPGQSSGMGQPPYPSQLIVPTYPSQSHASGQSMAPHQSPGPSQSMVASQSPGQQYDCLASASSTLSEDTAEPRQYEELGACEMKTYKQSHTLQPWLPLDEHGSLIPQGKFDFYFINSEHRQKEKAVKLQLKCNIVSEFIDKLDFRNDTCVKLNKLLLVCKKV